MVRADEEPSDVDREWSEAVAVESCNQACAAIGLDLVSPPELIRVGTNAVFCVHTPNHKLAVRAAPADYDGDLLHDQILFASWLCDMGFPTSRPAREEITWVSGRPVTFWEFLDGRPGGVPDRKPLGELLARFHRLTDSYAGPMPAWEPLGRLGDRLETAHIDDGFGEDDRAVLCAWRDRLTATARGMQFTLPAGPLHGDVHLGNVIVVDGLLHLIDLDRIARGPREWDLATVLASHEMFGTPRDSVDAFMEGYGWDLRGFPEAESLTRLRALFQTSWLVTLPRTEPVVEEIARRMRFWRDPSDLVPWRAV